MSVFAFDDTPFTARLAEAIAWCAPRATPANPRDCLRSEQLRPRLLDDRVEVVRSVARARTSRALDEPFARDLAGGRLLVYWPDLDLCDGASEVESRGFFDVNNTPPWDTWVALAADAPNEHGSYVVAWVPPALVALADLGVRVNPEGCIEWLEDSECQARAELAALLPAPGSRLSWA